MSTFWIIGIVINVSLTVAALVWVFREMKSRPKDEESKSGYLGSE